ncbi:phytanoyl-CoA dioxygenase family protein [Paenibacillus cremeus]|uniref:Phytanoyl-CoA dioxygenase n=1 Tax=Paenibacillus cremeus TaxID=2163881 RepID=A0A559JVX3_9BACL|nr:phytanoyl-CoA dioxygenase family protein [Paenibacillus cremeus]TVY04018.1 hypothetical protein FPZ49_30915 [Paenibacillus cremeus]
MRSKVLTPLEIEQFMEYGYIKLEQAYPRKVAMGAQNFIWDRLKESGVSKSDSTTWTEPMIHIREAYDDDVFQICNTNRLADAIEDLIGEGRFAQRIVYGKDSEKNRWGWWPVNFSSGADRPWTVPTNGWHWDGIHFRHYIDSPDQGLLCLCLFSDVSPKGGGTLVAEGSHKLVARFLNERPEGIDLIDGIKAASVSHPWLAELTDNTSDGIGSTVERNEIFMNRYYRDSNGIRLKVVETTGLAGDVFLCHPFLFHSASQNHSSIPRFMCNRTTPLKEKMNLNRANDAEYSPLERSIKLALADTAGSS